MSDPLSDIGGNTYAYYRELEWERLERLREEDELCAEEQIAIKEMASQEISIRDIPRVE